MSINVNREVTHTGATNTVIPLNRWGDPNYSLQIDSGTWLLEGTLDRVNRGETPTWDTLDDSGGTAITAVTDGVIKVLSAPVEAVRLTSTGAGTARFFQSGLSGTN